MIASNFHVVLHEFRAGTSSEWWKTAYAAMSPGGGWDEAIAANKEKGFYSHSANSVNSDGPVYCSWETKENITVEEFFYGPTGPGFGMNALMNICKQIDTSSMNGLTPYPGFYA